MSSDDILGSRACALDRRSAFVLLTSTSSSSSSRWSHLGGGAAPRHPSGLSRRPHLDHKPRQDYSARSIISGMTPDERFGRELEIFRAEAEAAAQFFFAYLTVHAVAHQHKSVHAFLNRTPLFWNTCMGALQTSAFRSARPRVRPRFTAQYQPASSHRPGQSADLLEGCTRSGEAGKQSRATGVVA